MSAADNQIGELEPKLKEILYKFLEEMRTTKAALYLSGNPDRFDLVTQYGFRSGARKQYAFNDDLIDRIVTRRAPFYINGLTSDPRFSELMYAADTSRMLIAPIYSRGSLVGFVDLRDKARQEPFDDDDLRLAQRIVDQFLDFFAEQALFGQKPAAPARPTATEDAIAPRSQVGRVIEDAATAIARGVLRPRPVVPLTSDAQISAASLVLPGIVALPGVALAALGPISRLGGTQIVAARAEVTPEAMAQVESKVRGWLKKRGESGPAAVRTTMLYPFGSAGAPIEPSRLASILSAPVRVSSSDSLVLTVAFDVIPDATLRSYLERFLVQLQEILTLASAAESVASTRQKLAEFLLEPDLLTYPHLVAHCRRVSELSEKLAQYVGLEPPEVELIRIAAMVHDVGMRLLDYKTLYRKDSPSTDDLRILRSHPLVGAALVAVSPLGPQIANLVLSHHERPDGTGYPDRLSGDQIPVGSKIIHICEAFDAMTAPDSYQPAVPTASAVEKIRRGGATQFDAELAIKFSEMIG